MKIIAVIGPPYSGKSTLCKLLSERLNAKVLFEYCEIPPFVVNEIKDGNNSLALHMFFRNERVKNLCEALKESGDGYVILDTCVVSSEIHLNLINNPTERKIASTVAELDRKTLSAPDYIFGLTCSKDQLAMHINNRQLEVDCYPGVYTRTFKIAQYHRTFYENNPNIRVLDMEGYDIKKVEDFEDIFRRIKNYLDKSLDKQQ